MVIRLKKIAVKGDIIRNDDKWLYDWLELESVCPADVNNALNEAAGGNVEVEINSSGGDIFAGSEIYTALRSYGGTVNIGIVGLAASAAGVIAQAGMSSITPTGLFMLHNVSAQASGDYHGMEHTAAVLKTANQSVANAYMAKTGMKSEELLALMDRETWLPAQRAVELGFVDCIMFENSAPPLYNSAHILNRSTVEKLKSLVKNQDNPHALNTARAQLNLLKLTERTIS